MHNINIFILQTEQDLNSEQQMSETRELIFNVLDNNDDDNDIEDEGENTAKFIINNYNKLSTR